MSAHTQTTAALEAAKPSCPYCSKPMEQPHKGRIVDRGWDPVRRKQFVREREMEFCSAPCAGNYQMGCEG